MKTLFSLLLVLITTVGGFTQGDISISGRLFDMDTHDGLAFVSVALQAASEKDILNGA